ncbi:MAG: hypothetical protein AAFM92_10425 [Pseudomonadota bacterium]
MAKFRPKGRGARLILAGILSDPIRMTAHSRIWAIGTLVIFLPLGAFVMLGGIPGAGSELEALQGVAVITSFLAAKHGAFLTRIFYMLVGCVLAAVFLVHGDYLRRADGDGSGAVGDCGGGGD